MTDTDGRDRKTLGGQSHANPYTGERFGDTQTYARGHTLAADGGRPNAADRRRGADGADGSEDATVDAPGETDARRADERGETLRDVDHTPRQNAPKASAAYMRGNEEEDDERADDPASRRGEGTRGGRR